MSYKLCIIHRISRLCWRWGNGRWSCKHFVLLFSIKLKPKIKRHEQTLKNTLALVTHLGSTQYLGQTMNRQPGYPKVLINVLASHKIQVFGRCGVHRDLQWNQVKVTQTYMQLQVHNIMHTPSKAVWDLKKGE